MLLILPKMDGTAKEMGTKRFATAAMQSEIIGKTAMMCKTTITVTAGFSLNIFLFINCNLQLV
jgi:hypothetical protein